MISRLVPQGGIVFDVGAHAGQFTKLFARYVGAGQVYAFEPGSYARAILRTVVALRRLSNVAIMPIALGSNTAAVTLTMPRKASGAFGFGLAHLGPPELRWDEVAEETVMQSTLDSVVAALALDRLDFIKVDIEGWELHLLRGAKETIRRFRPRLLIELAPDHLARAGDRVDDLFAFLAERDYRAFEYVAGDRLREVAGPQAGDLWFISATDPVIGGLPLAA